MTEIYKATEKEAGILGVLHVEGWKGAYGGIINQEYLDNLQPSDKADLWTDWLEKPDIEAAIAYSDNHPVGFVAYGRIQTPPPGQSAIRPLYTSEILALYILPDYWRKGVGTALLKFAAKELKPMKHTSMCLWVLDKNKRACDFYEKMGAKRIGKQFVEIGGTKAKEVCYGWRYTHDLI